MFVPACSRIEDNILIQAFVQKNYTVTGNTFCFGFIQGACRIGSGSRQSVCPATNGTISVVTGYTKIDSCIRGTGLGRIRIPVGRIESRGCISCNTSGTGSRSEKQPRDMHPDLLNPGSDWQFRKAF
jgi:hypothetical protein